MPRYDNEGYEYTYDVFEKQVPGYKIPEKNGFDFINTRDDAPVITPVTNTFYFSFIKEWRGTPQNDISFTLYTSDGTLKNHRFTRKKLSDTEWLYEAWLSVEDDYYAIESPMDSFIPFYSNIGDKTDVTDRVYNGGKIINVSTPNTNDTSNPLLWGIIAATSSLLLIVLIFHARKKQ
ncbi:MAG: Cna B-type domain-containing protein [Clostridia bacterium]|nr:Cna B-type domain-containing protein [Clostridia bacterium]